MREIKFKVWDIKYKEMLTAHQMTANDSGEFNNNPHRIPLQYTGLKDKNGKEIYEGDIYREVDGDHAVIGEVRFLDGSFVLDFCKRGIYAVIDRSYYEGEVIGNIYENPELLNN